jgi:sporulation protein YlmC with PRC-barrel domain
MTLIDEAQRRWCCYGDDQVFLAKEGRWVDGQPSGRVASVFCERENLLSKHGYDRNGRLIGAVRDMDYSLDGQAALLVRRQDQETCVRLSDVAVVGEITLLKEDVAVAEGHSRVLISKAVVTKPESTSRAST